MKKVKVKVKRKRAVLRKPRGRRIANDIGDSIGFYPHVDGVIVFDNTISGQTGNSDNLFITPIMARKMATALIKMATWIEQTKDAN